MRVSYSALDTYKKCPQKYKFQEIERRKAPKSKEALFGTAVHEALKYMFSRDPLFPTLEEVLASFREMLAGSKIADIEKKRYEASGEKMIRTFFVKNPPWNFTVIDLESCFEVALNDARTGRNHVLVGKIDRIDKPDEQTYEIIDYKTSSKLPSQETVDENLQLSLYHLGIKKRWPHIEPKNVILSLYFLKAGEKLSTHREEAALRETEEKILADIRTIEQKMGKDEFPPTPSALCNWCGYRPICPAWRHLYEKDAAPLPQKMEVEKMIGDYAQLKSEIAEREGELKKISSAIHEYLNETGLERLFGNSLVLARKIQERSSVDLEKLQTILEPAGLWQQVLAPDPKLLKKLLPTLSEDIQEKVKEAIFIKKFTVLSLSKKKPNEKERP